MLGFDDVVCTDHDFGPRLQVFLPAGTPPPSFAALPASFEGHPTVFAVSGRNGGEPSAQVEVTDSTEVLGDPRRCRQAAPLLGLPAAGPEGWPVSRSRPSGGQPE